MDSALPQKSLKDLVLGMLFPELCLHCSEQIPAAGLICGSCGAGGYLKPAPSIAADDGIRRRFAFSYEGVGKTLFTAAKFGGRRRAVKFLTSAVHAELVSLAVAGTVFIAMPSRRRFLRQLLAASVPRQKLVFNAFSMRRKIFGGDANKLLGEAERYKRIHENLRLNKAVLPAADHYVLCDDVSTTGATLAQAACLLQNAGIPGAQITIWALMHRPRHFAPAIS